MRNRAKIGIFAETASVLNAVLGYFLKPYPFWMRNWVKIGLFSETASGSNADSGRNWAIYWNRIRFESGIGSKLGYLLKLYPFSMRNSVKIGLFSETVSGSNADWSQNWAIYWNRIRFKCGFGSKSGYFLKLHLFWMPNRVKIRFFFWNRIRFSHLKWMRFQQIDWFRPDTAF